MKNPEFLYFLLIPGITIVFYAVLPAVGAFLAREQWRKFRRTVITVSHYPTASPAAVSRSRGPFIGFHRFFGTLEAIQGDDRIWITNGHFSVAADLRDVHVYLIPESEASADAALGGAESAGTALGSVPWSRIFSLPEGTPVFVGGALYNEEGRGVFRDGGDSPLLLVIHDCPRENVVLRAIGSGRERNEYMNAFTLPAVCIGALLLVLLAFSLFSPPQRLLGLLALTAGLAPVSPFLPPGFPLYFAYRAYWKKGRLLRVQRDLVQLPLRYFPPPGDGKRDRRATLLPDLEPYVMIRGRSDPGDPHAIMSGGTRIALPPGITRLTVRLPRRFAARAGIGSSDCVVFAGYVIEGDELRLTRPEDPMSGQMLVPGDPREIARASERAARSCEVLSVLFLALNIIVNVPLIFMLLSLLIR
jgi:hypothetical protein